ncbi:PREDICTED: uncharacterized protein LOC108758512 [Trachymyrmex cornetzi]|uniref:uncharacterized protein LOC108758512 n=1 Tax=Trachymyrmex cornetzi TaxID=471704 RepID=UPI00084EEC3D|nr:PREDICTED: uncharacterized protein LOC108758512 [Trachymyrmex cornetzi]
MRSCKIREFANLIGTLVAACHGVNYGWVYLKTLEREKILALIYNQNDYDQKMEISEQVRTDLNWWKRNIQQSVSNIRSPNFDWTIYTDASMTGWGAVLGSKKIHGFWNKTEREQHINFLELKAIQLALKNFEIELENSNVLLKVDNTTAISYINKMGGVKYQKFNHLAKEIWKWDETRDIWLFAVHIPSEKNVIADRLSRIKNIDTEWEIAEFAFEKIVNVLGYPDIDLFASERNKKCTRYCTWENNPNAWVEATSNSSENYTSGRDCVRRSYLKRNIPIDTIEILLASISDNTWKQYNSGLKKKWWSFCAIHKENPYQISANKLLRFLTKMFSEGASYGSLNSFRSAISLVSHNNIGEDPMVCRFLRGVANLKPIGSRYAATWDPSIVLDKVKTWYPVESLNLRELTEKTIILLALGTAHRAQTFASIDLENINQTKDGLEIQILDRLKTSRPGRAQPLLIVPFFDQKRELCIARTLLEYVKRTGPLRGDKKRLFVAVNKPHRSVSTQTISRWIKSVLGKCGIDISLFSSTFNQTCINVCSLR